MSYVSFVQYSLVLMLSVFLFPLVTLELVSILLYVMIECHSEQIRCHSGQGIQVSIYLFRTLNFR